jgi:hypothetical protein
MAIGRKTGGRQKGSRNIKTVEMVTAIEATGETPLEYMLRVMRDKTVDHSRRDDMAKAASPYVHSRLATLDHKSSDGSMAVPVLNVIESDDQPAPSPKAGNGLTH